MLARMMVPEEFGVYLLTVSVVSLLVIVSQLGLQVSVVRFVSEAMSGNGRDEPTDIALKCALIGLAGATLTGVVFALGGHNIVVRLLEAPGLADHANLIVLWVGVAAPLGILAESFRGSQQYRLSALFGGLSSTLIMLFCVLSLYAMHSRISLELILSLCAGASASSLLMALFYALAGREPVSMKADKSIGELLRVSLPLMIMSLATLVTTQADLWVAGSLLDKSDVAAYGIASRLVQLVLMPLLVVNAIMAPVIAQFHAEGARARLQRVLGAYAALGALPGIVVLALFSFFAAPVLTLLYGEVYGRAADCLVLLSLGQLINSFCGPAATVLMMSGRERAVMIVSVGTAVITVLGGLVLGRLYGMEGVAAAAAAGSSIHGALCLFWVRRSLGIWTYPRFADLRRNLAGAQAMRRRQRDAP